MYYHEVDFDNHDTNTRKYLYNFIGSLNHNFGTGIVWNMDKSPIFLIERVESVLIEEGCSNPDFASPPLYEPVGVETIIVKPKLKYPKR